MNYAYNVANSPNASPYRASKQRPNNQNLPYIYSQHEYCQQEVSSWGGSPDNRSLKERESEISALTAKNE